MVGFEDAAQVPEKRAGIAQPPPPLRLSLWPDTVVDRQKGARRFDTIDTDDPQWHDPRRVGYPVC
ncbi:hypothetical protein P775_04315 [Puniceibacterium antarcticum]|uniref:Uncharacterized protein n=1 Tax=Puniceibacterium antarcticum TaxID=1206336 RepID=A0A2G8RIS6_9RHOB|nr:hypothetical protein P775_04315 [Puniceibacterium antarcticum]